MNPWELCAHRSRFRTVDLCVLSTDKQNKLLFYGIQVNTVFWEKKSTAFHVGFYFFLAILKE